MIFNKVRWLTRTFPGELEEVLTPASRMGGIKRKATGVGEWGSTWVTSTESTLWRCSIVLFWLDGHLVVFCQGPSQLKLWKSQGLPGKQEQSVTLLPYEKLPLYILENRNHFSNCMPHISVYSLSLFFRFFFSFFPLKLAANVTLCPGVHSSQNY